MEKEPMEAFTNRIICFGSNQRCWYEYCPSNEVEFKEMLKPLLHSKCVQHDALMLRTINSFLRGGDAKQLHTHSTVDAWADAYWALYLQGEIMIGYMKAGRVGLKVFTAQKPDYQYLM